METFSINRLSKLTGADRRTLAKYLAPYDPDGGTPSRKEYSIKTVCIALAPTLIKESASGKSAVDVDKLEPIDRKHHFDAELKRTQLATLEGTLVEREAVLDMLSSALKDLSLGLDIIPDRIELACGLAPDQIAAMIGIIDECKQNLAASLMELAND